jgi:hypothetical protein
MKVFNDNPFPKGVEMSLSSMGFELSLDIPGDIYYLAGKGAEKRLVQHISQRAFKYYTQVPGTIHLGIKHLLWVALAVKIGKEKAMNILPETFLLNVEKDRKALALLVLNNPNLKLILKSNQHKRKGLKVVKGNQWEQTDAEDKFIIAQPVMPTTKKFTERPFHIRSYIVITLFDGELTLWLCPQGKLIYGEVGEIITNNQIKPEKGLPLFIDELHEIEHGINDLQLLTQLEHKMNMLVFSIVKKVFQHAVPAKDKFAQLLGVDSIILPSNEIRIIEFNFGPELEGLSEKDSVLKKALLKDLMEHFLINKSPAQLMWKMAGKWKM